MSYFNSEKFLHDYRIRSWPAGEKNVPAGCIGLRCPFCGDQSNHLHHRIGTWSWKCWRCGKHKTVNVIMALIRVKWGSARELIDKYKEDDDGKASVRQLYPERTTPKGPLTFPAGTGPLTHMHIEYLIKRGFDPFELERIWGLKGTNHLDPDYRFRIIAPYYYNQMEPVSFQARDVTGQQEPKYRAARPEVETIPHRNILYGISHALITHRIVIVEGITDVWRLGPGAVAISGANWTPAQAVLISQIWREAFILLDPDEAGSTGGLALYNILNPVIKSVKLLSLETDCDPGDLPESEAKYIMEKLLKVR